MSINNLRIGDLIVRGKGPLSAHYIVYVGVHNGVHMVAENQMNAGVRYVSLETALAGNSIRRFERFGGSENQRSLVIPRINELLGRAYDLVVFNCEHFARWIAKGKLESKQVKVASTTAIVAGAGMMIASRNPVVQFIGFASIIAGIIGHGSQRK